MAFINGYRSRDGVLLNKMWSFANTNVDSLGWRQPPGWQGNVGNCSIGSGYMGNEAGDMLNAVLIPIDPLAVGGGISNVLYASFDIEGHHDYKRELRFLVTSLFSQTGPDRYDGSYVVRPYLRIYTDETTYTDTAMGTSPQSVQIHRNDGSGVYERTTGIVFANVTYNNGHYVLIGAAVSQDQNSTTKYLEEFTYYEYTNFFVTLGGTPKEEEFSPEYGDASVPDGYGNGGVIGSHDKHSDHSGIPTKPQYGFTSAGFLNHYRISAQGLSMLGEALFPEPIGSSSSVEEAIDKLIANSWNSKILDYIVDCRIIPVTPSAPTQEYITCGGKVLVHPSTHQQYTAYLIDEDFVDVDCGYVETPLVEGNFLDFYNLKCKLFLPFYGFVDIEPEYWMGAKIGVYYRFNCMDGSFMCWVTSKAFRTDMNADDVIGQYSGNACIHIPISSQSYSQIVNGLITTGASVVGAVAGGAAGGKIAGTIASGAATAITSRPTLNKSNSYSGSSALMSKRTPYLLIEFNEAQFSKKYVEEQGLPAVVTKTLGQCDGFTQASNPILDGIPCTEAEKERIRSALASGLIFKTPVTPP